MGHASSHHDSPLDADLGDVLSFYQRLEDMMKDPELIKEQVVTNNNRPGDVYFVMNGDFLHGTFLGTDPPHFLSGILEQLPFDVVTLGEHDLSSEDSLRMLCEPGGLFDEWGDRLITSNVRVMAEDETGGSKGSSHSSSHNSAAKSSKNVVPLGYNYKILKGNQGTILVLGFLYNMDSNSKEVASMVTVEDVQDVLNQAWFRSLVGAEPLNTNSTAISTEEGEQFTPSPEETDVEFDAILVMAHMDVQDELITLLHTTLREYYPTIHIQFITGHTHKRSAVQLDLFSSSVEAGRYLDTVGYVSFDPQVANSMEHVFINANKGSLVQSLGLSNGDANLNGGNDSLSTKEGMELSQYIQRTMDHSGANEIVGCSNTHYRADGQLDETDSLFRLYLERVLPASYFAAVSKVSDTHHHSHGSKSSTEGGNNVFVQYLEWSSVRYDLFSGVVTMNDIYGVVPVDDAIVKLGHTIRGDVLLQILEQMNNSNATNVGVGVSVESSSISDPISSSSLNLLPPYGIQDDSTYTLHTFSQYASDLQDVMVQLDLPAVLTASSSTKTQDSVRGLWIDYIKHVWPYDGDDCKCLQEENGCVVNTDYIGDTSTGSSNAASGGGSSGSSHSGGGSGDKSDIESWTTNTNNNGSGSGGGTKSTHVSHTPPSRATPTPHHTNHSKNKHGNSNLGALWVTIAAGAIVIFVVLRFRRRGTETAVRRSELEGSNDLELQQESAAAGAYGMATGGGYASPAMPSRGTYV